MQGTAKTAPPMTPGVGSLRVTEYFEEMPLMDHRKKLLNRSEETTENVLKFACQDRSVRISPKVRVADALDITNSGLDNEHYKYALSSHLDFVIADESTLPLFAVEFDGPTHWNDERACINDRKKNKICSDLGLPLIRVRDKHIITSANKKNYLVWFVRMFFAQQIIVEAQDSGYLPQEEVFDPMLTMSDSVISEHRFPLWLSLQATGNLHRLFEQGVISTPTPSYFAQADSQGWTHCLCICSTPSGQLLWGASEVFIEGIGVAPSEAAYEIAKINLSTAVFSYSRNGEGGVSPKTMRDWFEKFLAKYPETLSFGGAGVNLGFDLRFSFRDGQAEWVVV